jgi:hypothetical protein
MFIGAKCLRFLVALFLAGCAVATEPAADPQRAQYDQKMAEISSRHEQCTNQAAAKAADEFSRIAAAADAFAELSIRTAKSDYYWDVWECQAEAYRENEKLSAQERADYGLEQKQARDHAALMGMLLSSQSH